MEYVFHDDNNPPEMKHSWKLGLHFKEILGIFPSGSVVKNPPADAGDTGSIPDQDPTAAQQLSPWATTTEAVVP